MSYRQRAAQKRKRAQKEQAKQKRKKSKGGFFSRFFRWMIKTGFQLAIVAGLILFGIVYYYSTTIPEYEEIVDGRRKGSVTFLDRHGEVFAWRGDQYDGNLRASNASENLVNAVIATEDKRFYHHFGVSPRGIARAMAVNYRENGHPFRGQGGSTITTQVAKLMCLGVPYDKSKGTQAEYEAECRRSTLDRKLKEIPYAMALEWKFTKEEILSIYLNRAYMGAGTYGFGAASKRYFGIPATGLDAPQSAMLAGMLTAPSRYAPTNDLQRSQDRAATVVRLMNEQGYLSDAEAQAAIANPATLSPSAQSDLGLYFADWIMQDQPDFLTNNTSEDIIYYTTFDPQIQRYAEKAVDDVFTELVGAGSRAEVAVVVMDRTGAVRAIVGGRFDEDRIEQGFNRATQAMRQPGSSFKPFVYAAALNTGLEPYDTFTDSPISVNVPGQGLWTPKNYSNRYSYAPLTMIQALKNSTNTVAVELSERAGRKNVANLAHSLGIKSPIAPGPASALGSSEVTLMELTTAYNGLLNGGRPVITYGWTQVGYKSDNAIIATNSPQYGGPVMVPEQAGWLIYMMNQVVENGTGTRAKIPGYQLAGKTGTTSEAKDALFVGFSADFVTGVWMGYDDNTPLKGTTGGGLPAEIWKRTMKPVLAMGPAQPLPMVTPPAPPPPEPEPLFIPVDPNLQNPTPRAPRPQAPNNAGDVIENLLDLLLN